MSKQKIIKNLLEKNNADAILLYSPQNRYWFSRFHSSLGYLIVTKENSYLFLDGRYITAALNNKNIPSDIKISGFNKGLWDSIKDVLKNENIKTLAFESDWVHYSEYEQYKTIFKELTLKPVDTSSIRIIKDEWEIKQIQKACDITNEVFESVLKFVKPGMTEKELQRFVDNEFLVLGADKISFDTIVASGINGAMPHAVPSDKKIQLGELVTLDMGCYYNGYCSDQTRTFAMGEIDKKLEDIYNTVFEAQSLGISLVKAGEDAGEIHKAVAKYIDERGYAGYFTHGLGHGYGVEIHEEPYTSPTGNRTLEPNMTITIEPGIYIPEIGGVRIEDDLLVTNKGYKLLTSARRELVKIKF
ncbi:M24 family metallopeptidase [Mesoplasma corruscae]|uniref:Xaa-Pro dipeptidase n=1 Tax=Mesoplasma corruscae TaxID=216874 RepID=A0A2S5RG42_9MOLU|nr:aminopeptidase P family protein [Mesoplasma corruscae]PPE06280.1 Xaa-Pro dipeptidase [Mesoplasma corruscae]